MHSIKKWYAVPAGEEAMRFAAQLAIDALYLACLWAIGFYALAGEVAWTVASCVGLAILEHGHHFLPLGRFPRFLKFLGRGNRMTLLYCLRHGAVAGVMFSALPESQTLVAIYSASALIGLALSTVFTNNVRRLSEAKFPFISQIRNISPTVWTIFTDYTGDLRDREVAKVRLIEILLAAIPITALTLGLSTAIAPAAAAGLIVCLLLGWATLWIRAEHTKLAGSSLQSVRDHLASLRPEIMFFFSGGKGSTFQANMWLPVLEALEKNVIVVFRERHHMADFKPTTVPLAYANSTRDLEGIVPNSVKVTLYASNVGKNVHWLRNTANKHIFIGHGDSDKPSSAHNVMKAYDHMFVAGQAHIDRMVAAGLRMPAEYYIKVGRPQLELFFGTVESPSSPSVREAGPSNVKPISTVG